MQVHPHHEGPETTSGIGPHIEAIRVPSGDSLIPEKKDPWSACAVLMKEYDIARVKMWKEDIDTLLVFAGLFSAVVTAFSAQSYSLLQSDNSASALLLLEQISLQLNEFGSINAQINGTKQSPQLSVGNSNFSPAPYAVRLNILWFSSLVCSLVDALIGILAKQWLREYMSECSSSPREAVHLRQHRYNGLIGWYIPEIIAFLPLLLEIALVLFLIGLIELLWSLHPFVAGVVSVLVAVSLLFYVCTSILPILSVNCPYKSPQSWLLLVVSKTISSPSYTPATIHSDWRCRDFASLRGLRSVLDGDAVAWCYESTSNDDLLDCIIPAIQDLQPSIAVDFAFRTMANIAGCSVPAFVETIRSSTSGPLSELLILVGGPRGTSRLVRMLLDVLPKVPHDSNSQSSHVNLLDTLSILRQLLMGNARAFCEDPLHRQALVCLNELVNDWEPVEVQWAALRLLWEMASSGCNTTYCPDGIGNVLTCARNALSRGDLEMFCTASAVALARIPSLRLPAHEYALFRRMWLQNWLSDIEHYFLMRNSCKLPHYIGSAVKWCTGLAGLAKVDRSLLSEHLLRSMDESSKIGVLCYDPAEMDAWEDLKASYEHTLHSS